MNIVEFQRRVEEAPRVWGVYVTCEGETDIVQLYDTREAAKQHQAWYNDSKQYGKSSVEFLPVLNKEIAQLRFE